MQTLTDTYTIYILDCQIIVNSGACQASLLLRPYRLLTLCHFFYYAKNIYVNSVNASLQYANSVTAILPLCQFSTLPFYSMIKNNMPFRRLLKDRSTVIYITSQNTIVSFWNIDL